MYATTSNQNPSKLDKLKLLVVYTCQRPKATGCDFFLWLDEAKAREVQSAFKIPSSEILVAPRTPVKYASALITPPSTAFKTPSSELLVAPRTPVKYASALITPPSTIERDIPAVRSSRIPSPITPSKSSGNTQSIHSTIKATAAEEDDDDDEDVYDWSSGADDELSRTLPSDLMSPPTVPRKALKTDAFSTPGKRTHGGEANPLPEEDVFTTPTKATPMIPGLLYSYSLPSPADTPCNLRFRDSASKGSDLATQLMQVFDRRKIPLSSDVKAEVRAIAKKHDMHLRGAIKGRDISRAAITKKSEEIIKLKENIAALEADRQVLGESMGI